jgi:predicted nucleotidyltransferase
MLDLQYSREQLEELCRRFHVKKLSVFGSTLRGEARPDSDLDLLVEFEAGKKPGYQFFALQQYLSELFNKQVDLNTAEFLGRRFRQEIIDHAKSLYVN